jgi:pimeloyl-ACP methyl ester carboxylesterase
VGFVQIEGYRVHYAAPRDPSERRGQRVLYVHGTGCNSRVWASHMAEIADAHTPLAIDLPGHGESEGRAFRGVADYAHVTVLLARALGWDRFVLAGHSMGGAVALTTAIYHPELLTGLMLIDTGARLRVDPRLLRPAREAAERGHPVSVDRSWAYASGTPQAVVDAVHELTAGTDPAVTYADWIADDTFDMLHRVKDVHVPTLAVCGEDDRLTPVKYHQYLHAQMPRCELTIIPRAGHWVFHEQPAAFTRAVRMFLDRLPTA